MFSFFLFFFFAWELLEWRDAGWSPFAPPALHPALCSREADLAGPRQWALMSSGFWLCLTSGDPGRRSESRRTEVLVYHPLFLRSCLRLALLRTNMRSLLLVLHSFSPTLLSGSSNTPVLERERAANSSAAVPGSLLPLAAPLAPSTLLQLLPSYTNPPLIRTGVCPASPQA